jgi:REP element-mobilizing transposase RayT
LSRYKPRKHNRLLDYDYSTGGYYFVTACAKHAVEFFGEVNRRKVVLSDIGRIAVLRWREIPSHYKDVEIDQFIIMPNHIHGIIVINEGPLTHDKVETEHCSVSTNKDHEMKDGIKKKYGLLSRIIKSYKGVVTKDVRRILGNVEFGWQRSFYDHVIRNDVALKEIRKYIINNPAKWDIDENNPANIEDWGIKNVKET